jgi:hypothetical protein
MKGERKREKRKEGKKKRRPFVTRSESEESDFTETRRNRSETNTQKTRLYWNCPCY